MKPIVRSRSIILFILSTLLIAGSIAASGLPPQPTFTWTQRNAYAWDIWRDQYFYGATHQGPTAELVADSLNFTNGCETACVPPTFPPCNVYFVTKEDHETWNVWLNDYELMIEINIEADAYHTRDSLAITHNGGMCAGAE